VIATFEDAEAARLWQTGRSRRLSADLQRTAFKNLAILNAAVQLENLAIPPGNRLEILSGDRKGQHSIRINQRYRICFVWSNGNAFNVEIVDYP
jgi:proteic killer suppression protein